ncbi:MAG: hypothetical protein P4L99_05000 [Chthoniobacter sp.]|nr:hypothetical protein [Chthoniobacter sp.]
MHLLRHLHHIPHLYRLIFALSLIFPAALLGYLLWQYFAARRNRPKIPRADILHQESFASGASQKNLLTQIGGAHNCLKIVVTKDLLMITSWFPFSLLTPVYDLEHVIPIRSIVSLDDFESFGRAGLRLIYVDGQRARHSIDLFPKSREALRQVLAIAPSQLAASP